MRDAAPESLLVLADRAHTFAAGARESSVQGPVALLIENGSIAAIGPAADVGARAGSATRLDLRGTTLTPGLTDAHIHLTEWALARREVDLSHATLPQSAAALAAGHARGTRTEWVRGRGWNAHLWREETAHLAMLDALIRERPVLLQSHDMHALWVNSETLRRAGIDRDTADPEGGRIVRDDAGEPTGLLLENAGQLVARILPALTEAKR